jgi:hypothetical protein
MWVNLPLSGNEVLSFELGNCIAAPLFARPLSPPGIRKKMTMLDSLQNLFRPADRLANERMAALEFELDAIAKETVSRFCRGNVAIQMGLLETPEELSAKMDATIARRR